MPEGHTVHRSAKQFNKLFAGSPLKVHSPQGRFQEDARLVDGRVLDSASAIGKQLFLQFENELVLRIHLGIYGKWSWQSSAEGEFSEPQGQVRARFENGTHLADLRGPTACEVLTQEQLQPIFNRLGPDPLNRDPDGMAKQQFVEKIKKSKKSIGLLLMDQSVVAGIGNVYRAELLFRAQISPYRLGSSLTGQEIEAIWDDAVALMQVGVKTGYMITRDELFTKRPTKAERNFVYKREGLPCRNCGVNVAIDLMATRKLYFCPNCQGV